MDAQKVGALIYKLRTERKMTQKQLAEQLHVSDKTISKWECGQGCPDVSLLAELSAVFGINIEKLLAGDLQPNPADGGNMKRLKFYVCPECGNVMTATGTPEISCCGRKLEPLSAAPADEHHSLTVEDCDGEKYITFSHEMTKAHYLSFVAYAGYDRVLLVKLYPEQSGELRMPAMHGGRYYFYCSRDGLFVQK